MSLNSSTVTIEDTAAMFSVFFSEDFNTFRNQGRFTSIYLVDNLQEGYTFNIFKLNFNTDN